MAQSTRSRLTGLGKLFSAGVQAIGVQLLGAVFFYLLSLYLAKETFGLISWANAVAMTLTTVLSFGLEQVVLRRIAAGNGSSDWTAVAYFLHALVASVLTLCILLGVLALFPVTHEGLRILPGFFMVQALTFLVTPLRQLLNARERFTPYALIAMGSNLAKIGLAWLWIRQEALSIPAIILLLLICTGAELAATLAYILTRMRVPLRFRFTAYTRLLREAAPQYLSVLFDVSLARADWILLGILGTGVAIAEYSFAYRAFEIARMPVTIIGMLLMPRLAPLLQRGEAVSAAAADQIRRFFRLEMLGGVGIALLLALVWVPLVDPITDGKYGASNAATLLLLACCIPVHFAINLLWTLCFAARQYGTAARITVITSLLNVGANIVLIPLYGGLGAAMAFLGSSTLQLLLYLRASRKTLPLSILPLLLPAGIAALIFIIVGYLPVPAGIGIFAGLTGYLLLAVAFRQYRRQDLSVIRQWLSR